RLKHGFAVGLGMIIEAGIASQLGLIEKDDLLHQKKVIESFGISPISYKKSQLIRIMKHDKKNIRMSRNDDLRSLQIPIVLPVKTGKVKIRNFSLQELEDLL
ncbi:MAG: hypothetical protein KKH98_15785, partial [Spirochaetes bacterium]|nr:hypothetical protein [Spirochaetota bacterium]